MEDWRWTQRIFGTTTENEQKKLLAEASQFKALHFGKKCMEKIAAEKLKVPSYRSSGKTLLFMSR